MPLLAFLEDVELYPLTSQSYCNQLSKMEIYT
jgi:hypothetical protein